MAKDKYSSEAEGYEKDINSNIDREENFISIMYQDLEDINNTLPKIDSTKDKKELEKIYDQLHSADKSVAREMRKIYRFIKKIIKPYNSMVATARRDIKQLQRLIDRRNKRIQEMDKLASEHKTLQKLYKRDEALEDIKDAEEKIENLNAYINKADEVLKNEEALEQRLILYASRNGELHKRLGMIKKDIDSGNIGEVGKMASSLSSDIKETEKTNQGLFTSSNHLKKFVKNFRIAMIAVAMSLAAFSASGQEAETGSENGQNGLTESQYELVEERYNNLNRFAGKNIHEDNFDVNTNPGVYYENNGSGVENDYFVVVMRLGRTPQSQYNYQATMRLMSSLRSSNVILSVENNSIRSLPFDQEIKSDGQTDTAIMRIPAEFVEDNIILPSLQVEISSN